MRLPPHPLLPVLLCLACLAPQRQGMAAAVWPALGDLTQFELVRSDGGAMAPSLTSVEQAADILKDDDVVFLGELHEHTGNHLAEMALFRALYQRVPQLALSMEQFERDVQPVLDDYLQGRIGEDALRRDGRAWDNYPESYRPLVEFAKDHHLPVIAAEAPTALVRCVGQEGPEFLARLPADKRAWAAAELHLDDGPYKDKFLGFLTGDNAHGEDAGAASAEARAQAQAQALRNFAAQATRDDTMAESILLALQKNPGRKIVHLTGAFHVEGFLGTVERLHLRAPDLKLGVVAPVEVDDPDHPMLGAADAKAGTFELLLRPLPQDYVSEAEMKAAIAREQTNFRTLSKCTL